MGVIRTQFAGDRESIILSNLTGLMALSYSLCWLPIVVRNYTDYLGQNGEVGVKGSPLFLPIKSRIHSLVNGYNLPQFSVYYFII